MEARFAERKTDMRPLDNSLNTDSRRGGFLFNAKNDAARISMRAVCVLSVVVRVVVRVVVVCVKVSDNITHRKVYKTVPV